ncbi:1-aminocyclopropane-1-carboxylate deaminase/D-cysteine desulfhydrase [Microbulbifer aggregans]|uniref:1-aminocyclopropane-1-carboxylate deaminase/D-cysteine desulfhydrase n=1 Tax=Microbulbifer aggregans TaxID=1769779 RepID=UPI001CFE891A|nr:pyridoxal-phosphate dependent enzyme [Microbulbifer aggregans]
MIRYLTELSLKAFDDAARNIPYQQIQSELFPGVDLWVRRDDLIDPVISGNKAYKLIYNLLQARDEGRNTIVTCGGAWSNHIHATAAAGQRFGFKTVGIIRGQRPPELSAMLQDAERFGMELLFVTRADYRRRHEPGFVASACRRSKVCAEDYWFVPEGGANRQGAQGVQLLGKVIQETGPVPFEECWVPCGTGLTLGALASGLETTKAVGVAVLNAGQSIGESASKWASLGRQSREFELIGDCHHGGYGKSSEALVTFQEQMERQVNLVLDHVYTSKLLYALAQRLRSTSLLQESCQKAILLMHTGGLQGRRGVTKTG